MTLPGGPAAKLGHRYEMWWTLSELVRMLRGETDSLRLEPPGEDDVELSQQFAARGRIQPRRRLVALQLPLMPQADALLAALLDARLPPLRHAIHQTHRHVLQVRGSWDQLSKRPATRTGRLPQSATTTSLRFARLHRSVQQSRIGAENRRDAPPACARWPEHRACRGPVRWCRRDRLWRRR